MDLVAHAGTEPPRPANVHPRLPGLQFLRHRYRAAVVRMLQQELPAQRKSAIHRLDLAQLEAIADPRHARKRTCFGVRQPQVPGVFPHRAVDRQVSTQHRIATQQGVGAKAQGRGCAVGDETDAADRAHGEHQRGQQHAQLAGTQIAPEQLPAEP